MDTNGFFSNLFFKLTGKEGFTGRTYLWERAIVMIKNAPLFGYGVQEKGYLNVWGGYFSSHNVILEIMLQSGIIGLFSWLIMLIVGVSNIKKIKSRHLKRLFVISIFIILCTLLMESVTQSIYLWLLLTLINLVEHDSELGESSGRISKCSNTSV